MLGQSGSTFLLLKSHSDAGGILRISYLIRCTLLNVVNDGIHTKQYTSLSSAQKLTNPINRKSHFLGAFPFWHNSKMLCKHCVDCRTATFGHTSKIRCKQDLPIDELKRKVFTDGFRMLVFATFSSHSFHSILISFNGILENSSAQR